MTVDLSPILSSLVQLGALALMAVGGWAIQRFAAKMKVDTDSALVRKLDDALNKSIAAGATGLNNEIKQKGWDHPDVKNAVIRAGAAYLTNNWPDLLKEVGIPPGGSTSTYMKIQSLLDRAFPTAIGPVANSPATPPIPPLVSR